jgi:hypothetical protein
MASGNSSAHDADCPSGKLSRHRNAGYTGLKDMILRHVARDAERDEHAARARRVGAEAARDDGAGAGLTAWARESTGATRNGRMRMPRTTCGTCGGEYVQRADGRPNAHKNDGARCPGGGPA